MDTNFDVVVVGGGAAGLSGAVALARFQRTVLVIDAGAPRNSPAEHVHNFLTRDGTSPADIYAAGRAEVTRYGGRVEPGRVIAVRRDRAGFAVELADRVVRARRILVATGLHDELPDVPGLRERWGRDVVHCPYCHGWELRGRRIGILATGPLATHQALLFRQLSPHVTLLAHTSPPSEADREQLTARRIPVVSGEVVQVDAQPSGLTGVRFADRSRLALDAIAVTPRATPRAELLEPLGLEPVDVRMGEHVIGRQIEADPSGATAVRGVWVAGNVASVQAQVVTSAAAGLTAAAAINADLIAEEVAAARDLDISAAS
jgi:thioredoxin reductase